MDEELGEIMLQKSPGVGAGMLVIATPTQLEVLDMVVQKVGAAATMAVVMTLCKVLVSLG